MHRSLPLLLAVGLLAGCADDAPTQAVAPPADDLAQAAPEVPEPIEAPFGGEAAVGVPGADPEVQTASTNYVQFDVPEGAAWVMVEAGWTCTSPTCGLRIELAPVQEGDLLTLLTADRTPAAEASGDGNVTLSVEAPEPGEWGVSAHAEGASTGVAGVLRITYGSAAADGMAHAGH